MGGKVEQSIPAKVAGADATLGDVRLQVDGDDVHAHYGKLRFAFKGKRKFFLAHEALSHSLWSLDDGAIVVIPGDPSDPGKGRIACDLVLTRRRNKWKLELNKCATIVGDVVIGDEVLCALDEFVHRNC